MQITCGAAVSPTVFFKANKGLVLQYYSTASINKSEKYYSDQSNEWYCETTVTVLINKGSLK